MYEFPERPAAMVSSHVSHDGNYLIITINEGNDGKILLHYADLTTQNNKGLNQKLNVKPIVSEWIASYDYIHNIGKTFYFQTNYKSPLNKVVKFDIEKPSLEKWVDVIPEDPKNVL
jgi:prolyl oligopeptidase